MNTDGGVDAGLAHRHSAAAVFDVVPHNDQPIKGGESAHHDPDLRGLGEAEDTTAESGGGSADLVLVDLTGTRLADYRPPARSGCPTVVLTRGSENDAVATLHFCEDDLYLLSAASFLDSFAERIEEPALQLL
jgi:hypothetical protein